MKAIAMKATQEDWSDIKYLIKHYRVFDFVNNPYLVHEENGLVINCYQPNPNLKKYEKFDRAIFLDALDIVEEKIWKGSEMQLRERGTGRWLDCFENREYRLKPINPEVKQLEQLAEKLGYKIEKL